jgi:hypothetical protein
MNETYCRGTDVNCIGGWTWCVLVPVLVLSCVFVLLIWWPPALAGEYLS